MCILLLPVVDNLEFEWLVTGRGERILWRGIFWVTAVEVKVEEGLGVVSNSSSFLTFKVVKPSSSSISLPNVVFVLLNI